MAHTEIHTKRQQMLKDLLTTAVEGGIDYWCAAKRVQREPGTGNVLAVIGPMDVEDEDTKWPDITLDTVELGMRRLVDGSATARRDIVGTVMTAWHQGLDKSNYDSETADVIVQVGLFGEIVYG